MIRILHCSLSSSGSSGAHKVLSQHSQTLVYARIFGRIVKTQISGPHQQFSDSAYLGKGMRICTSNKSSGDADLLVLGPQFENTVLDKYTVIFPSYLHHCPRHRIKCHKMSVMIRPFNNVC